MPKRKLSEKSENNSKIRKIELSLDSKNDEDSNQEIEIPDLSRINIDEIENTIFEAVKRNNFSNAKAKYLIKQMLKHPSVVEWFRNIFLTENHDFNLSYEPRVTRAARRRGDVEDNTSGNELTAGLIGRLLLSAPTIISVDFDNEDCTDTDYLPDNDQSDSELSSITSECIDTETDFKSPSPYITRSKHKINDLQVDLIDDFEQSEDNDYNTINYLPGGDVFLEEMQNFMETDVDAQLYDEFKRSLNTNIFDNIEDDPEFDVFAQISELDEDIFDDCRNDRSVNIPKKELWALLKDNNLVDGNENSTNNKKTITMLCKSEHTSDNELNNTDTKQLFESHSLFIGREQRLRLERQISMFYQILATNFIMLYDQSNFAQLVASQIDLYFKIASNVVTSGEESVFNPPNRVMVENILFNYKGMNYIPTGRFSKNVNFKKVEFPKCLLATLLCSPAFPYRELLPTSFKLYHSLNNMHMFKVVPFLASEDKLLMHGIIQFGYHCQKMLKLIQKFLFPIRTSEQLRYRKNNILRRHKDLNHENSSLLVDLLQSSSGSSGLKVCSELSKVSLTSSAIWQRQDQWCHLPEVYLKFLKKNVPDIMCDLNLYDKCDYGRSRNIAAVNKNQTEKNAQYCNWTSLPWELPQVSTEKTMIKRRTLKSTLRKVVKEKSFPQYEIPNDSNFRKQLQKWNCYLDKKKSCNKRKSSKEKRTNMYICSKKLLKKSRRIIEHSKYKTSKVTQQSYAHYLRSEDTEQLFPKSLLHRRLEDIAKNKNEKSFRFLRLQAKCKIEEREMTEVVGPCSARSDEEDLIFCRNLLNNMHSHLKPEHYEKCLKMIYNFDLEGCHSDLDQIPSELDGNILDFIRAILELINNCDNNTDVYEDFLSLLTPLQASKLGLEIEYYKIKNFNQLYIMTKCTSNAKNRRFWSRLSSLMTKFQNGSLSISCLIHYLTNNFKHNPYLQSMIAPLLNCWQFPYPNFPETFANIDFLSSKNTWSQFQANAETDNWEYCDELSMPPKNACDCICHDNTCSKEGSMVKHCLKCSIKVSNGSVYLDEGKFHKRLVRIKWPSDFQQNSNECIPSENDNNRPAMVDSQETMSVLDFLRSKNTKNAHLHNRTISLKYTFLPSEQNVHLDHPEATYLNYNQLLIDDQAAMDVDTFRLIKGKPGDDVYLEEINHERSNVIKQEAHSSTLPEIKRWSDDDNMLLLTDCQIKGPSESTFEYLSKFKFPERSCEEIEAQFNYLYEQLLEHHVRAKDNASTP